MESHDQFGEISLAELEGVTGGGLWGTLYKGARAAYQAARPVLKEAADVVKDLGIIGGAGYAIKKGYDYATGGGQQPQQPQQPQH